MVAEFCAKHFPQNRFILDAKLGTLQTSNLGIEMDDSERRALAIYSRYCDAVVLLHDRTILIEAKITPRLGPLDGLILYDLLFKTDDAYKDRRRLPVEKWFVYAIEDPALNYIARSIGMRAIQYRPDWLAGYLATRRPRDNRVKQAAFL